LVELRLGSSAEKADGDNNTFTVDKFKAVIGALTTMPKLTVLEMQLLHVKEFKMGGKGTYLWLNVGIDHRGAQFIA
jgi:hypothetical protein